MPDAKPNRDFGRAEIDEPGLVRFSEEVTSTTDPQQAAKYADLFLLCVACVGTVFGSLAGGCVFLGFIGKQGTSIFGWMVNLLVCVALGGAVGSATVMITLHAKDLIRWENRKG